MENEFGANLANMDFDFLNEASVSCIFCEKHFTVNDDIQPMLKHLLETHKFVIGHPEEIADFRHYMLYWKKLQLVNLEDYCIVYITNTEDGAKAIPEKFYLLCDRLPEDRHLRTTLRQMKLNFITHQKEEEFQNKTFSRKCIYCPAVIGGGIGNVFQHLSSVHSFSLGNPGNIVFGAKLLDIMDGMLQRLQCLNCEKTFKNYTALRDHMRKKQHRSLNPKNKLYDKFYLLNYLKPGTPWEEAKRSVRENKSSYDIQPKDGDESVDEEQLWTDWREETASIPSVCLFCVFTTTKIPALLHHMEDYHHFCFESLSKDLNFYSKVKLINFIRTQVASCSCPYCNTVFSTNEDLLNHIKCCSSCSLREIRSWDNSMYMIPFLENDGLLIHLDDNEIEDEDTSSVASSSNEEIVLPEDSITFSSILNDWRLREELSKEVDGDTRTANMSWALFRCFFCSFTMSGFGGRAVCISHMSSIHGFDYKSVFAQLGEDTKRKVICYIRAMTELGQCHVCGRAYMSKSALEEHRMLEGHTSPPPPHLYEEDRWEKYAVMNDGFVLEEKIC